MLHAPSQVKADQDALARLNPTFDLIPLSEAARRRAAVVDDDGRPAIVFGAADSATRTWAFLRAPEACARPHSASAEGFDRWLAQFSDAASALDGAAVGMTSNDLPADGETLSLAAIDAESNPVIRFVDATLFDALQSGASDVHLEADLKGLAVKFRLDGVLARITRIDAREMAEQVVSRIKVLSELDIAERRLPQDGRLSVSFRGRSIDVRVSVMPSVHGEDVVMRILDRQHLARELEGLTLARLGFDPVGPVTNTMP